MKTACECLDKLGVVLPKTPEENNIKKQIEEINQLIGDREIKELFHLPVMKNREKIAIVKIANSSIPPAYNSGSFLL